MDGTPARAVREAWTEGGQTRNAWLTIPDAHLAEIVAARGRDRGGDSRPAARAVRPERDVHGFPGCLGTRTVAVGPAARDRCRRDRLPARCRGRRRDRANGGDGRGGRGMVGAACGSRRTANARRRSVLPWAPATVALPRRKGRSYSPWWGPPRVWNTARNWPPCLGSTAYSSGLGDLGLTMGLGVGQDRDEPELVAAFRRVLAACRGAGKRAGIHAASAGYGAKMAARASTSSRSGSTSLRSARPLPRRSRPGRTRQQPSRASAGDLSFRPVPARRGDDFSQARENSDA